MFTRVKREGNQTKITGQPFERLGVHFFISFLLWNTYSKRQNRLLRRLYFTKLFKRWTELNIDVCNVATGKAWNTSNSFSGIRELAVPWEHSGITNSRRGYKQSGHKPQQSITQTMRQPRKAFSGWLGFIRWRLKLRTSKVRGYEQRRYERYERRRYEGTNKEGTNNGNLSQTNLNTSKDKKTKTPPFIMVVATNVERIIKLTRPLNGWCPREISGRVGTSEFFTAAAGVLILKCSFEEVKLSLCFWILFLYNRYLPSKTLKWFPA